MDNQISDELLADMRVNVAEGRGLMPKISLRLIDSLIELRAKKSAEVAAEMIGMVQDD